MATPKSLGSFSALALSLVLCGSVRGADGPPDHAAGQSLVKVLQELRASGLNIIFSDNLVRPEYRVSATLRSGSPREILDDALAAHGLRVQDGPGGSLVVVRAPTTTDGAQPARQRRRVWGAVLDEQGETLVGATVTFTNDASQLSRAATTDAAGGFELDDPEPGRYTLRVALAGFRPVVRRGLSVRAEGSLAVGAIKLGLDGFHEDTIVLADEASTVDAQRSSHVDRLGASEIRDNPTRSRDPMTLLRLLPGVRYEDDIDVLGDTVGSPVPHVSGQRRGWNQVTVDGLNANELYGTGRMAAVLSLDAIAEVRVLDTYTAEHGRTGGANIEIITRSGGPEHRGSLYWFGRRDGWNANGWENKQAGLARPEYQLDTYGFNLGGPVSAPRLFGSGGKLTFQYSFEAPRVQRPADVRRFVMPTDAERRGDFSQTRDSAGRPVVIRDPTTGRPFPGNIIPPDRLDPNGLALLAALPLPNRCACDLTLDNRNFVRQETPDNSRWSHVLRLDWRPSTSDSVFVTARSFRQSYLGSEIPGGPSKWGFFEGRTTFTDSSLAFGYTHAPNSRLVHQIAGGVRTETSEVGTASESDYGKIRRSDVGFNLGQQHPELNPLGLLPRVRFSVDGAVTTLDYSPWLGTTSRDWIVTLQDSLTWTAGRHSFKAGVYAEHLANNDRAGLWMGELDFGRDGTNPLDTGHSFANALLGVFWKYTEGDAYQELKNRRLQLDWYAQDTWRVTPRLTLDYGARFLWFTPYYQADKRAAVFVPGRYDPARAPRLYERALIDGRWVSRDPVTGEAHLGTIFAGALVPGTGDRTNGMVLATDPSYPRGFSDQRPPQAEPRVGLAWDVFGNGKTALSLGAGLFHQAVPPAGAQSSLLGPPFYNVSSLYNGTLDTIGDPRAADVYRPSQAYGVERNAKTPGAFHVSLGVQQSLGFATIVDVRYVGSFGRHLTMQTNINAIPDGARFVDLHPENREPLTGLPKPQELLRPYRGYGSIIMRENWGTSSYNALQTRLTRRPSHGLQLSVSYTLAKAMGMADDDSPALGIERYRPLRSWHYARSQYNQTHSLVASYAWDVPRPAGRWGSGLAGFLLGGWQIAGENAWVSGDWAGLYLLTTDYFDFTGGENTARPVLSGSLELPRGQRDARSRWFNVDAVHRPSGRGDHGNAPRTVIELPGIDNWNLALTKSIALGGRRRLQLRVEAYNLLNHTQFRDVDRFAEFDEAGQQVNPGFGAADAARSPRVVQGSIRLTF